MSATCHAHRLALPGTMVACFLLQVGCTASEAGWSDPSSGPGSPDSGGERGPVDDTGEQHLPEGDLGQLREEGEPVVLDTFPTVNYRGVDTAWSEALGRFLTVYGNAPIGGAWLDADGRQLGTGFALAAPYDGSTGWTQNPRVVANADGFLVSWHEEQGGGPVVQVRKVEDLADPTALPPVELSAPGAFQESHAALAWSPSTDEHLVVWAQDGLYLRRLDGEGQPLAPAVALLPAGAWVEQPAVVHVPDCGCAFVTAMVERGGGAEVLLLRVEDGSGALLGEAVSLSGPLDFAKVTDLALDAARGEVVAAWYEVRQGVPGFAAWRFEADGTALGEARTVFAPYGSYDGFDLAWSPRSGTTLAVFHGLTAATVVGELALDLEDGPPLVLDPAGAANGVFLPRAVALPEAPGWLVTGAADYAAVVVQRVVRD